MKNHLRLLLCLISTQLVIFTAFAQQITGVIKDQKTQTPLPGVAVSVVKSFPVNGTMTDANGVFTLRNVPNQKVDLQITFLGYKTLVIPYSAQDYPPSKPLEIQLEEDIVVTSEVIITDKKANDHVENVQMSMNRLTIQEMRRVPALFGEVDVIKNIQQLPGVQSAGEGTSSFFVRGGECRPKPGHVGQFHGVLPFPLGREYFPSSTPMSSKARTSTKGESQPSLAAVCPPSWTSNPAMGT